MAFHYLVMGQVIYEIWIRKTNAMNNVIGKKKGICYVYNIFLTGSQPKKKIIIILVVSLN